MVFDRISEEAKQVHLGQIMLTVIASIFYALGWIIGKIFVFITWSWAAICVGWRDARGSLNGPN